MDLIQRLRERIDDGDVAFFLNNTDDTQRQRFVSLCQNTWNDWIQNNAVYCEGTRKKRVARELAQKVKDKAKLCGIFGEEPRTGFWEVIVVNIAVMIIKWLWEKWMDGE